MYRSGGLAIGFVCGTNGFRVLCWLMWMEGKEAGGGGRGIEVWSIVSEGLWMTMPGHDMEPSMSRRGTARNCTASQARHDIARYGATLMARNNAARHQRSVTTWLNMAPHAVVAPRHKTARYSKARHDAAGHSTARHGTARHNSRNATSLHTSTNQPSRTVVIAKPCRRGRRGEWLVVFLSAVYRTALR